MRRLGSGARFRFLPLWLPRIGAVSTQQTRPPGWLSKSHKHGPSWLRQVRLRFLRWRAAIHRNPQASFVYKWCVGTVGGIVIAGGLLLVPLPGPGWLIVFLGVAIIASEFTWARDLLLWGRALLHRWTQWLGRSHWIVRVLVAGATCAFVLMVVWGVLRLIGLPDWVPDQFVPGWLGFE